MPADFSFLLASLPSRLIELCLIKRLGFYYFETKRVFQRVRAALVHGLNISNEKTYCSSITNKAIIKAVMIPYRRFFLLDFNLFFKCHF